MIGIVAVIVYGFTVVLLSQPFFLDDGFHSLIHSSLFCFVVFVVLGCFLPLRFSLLCISII